MLMYVMPMMPGNTPNAMRRQVYMDMSLGIKMVNWWPVATMEAEWGTCGVDLQGR
jgi:hypothetical protein